MHRRGHDQVDRPVLVLEQHEGHALRGRGPLARDHETGHTHPAGVRVGLEVAARAEVGGQAGAHQLQRVLAEGHAGRAVVGEHPLPGAERPQLGPLVRVERQRQLGPGRDLDAGHGDPERPQRAPPAGGGLAVDERVARARPGEPAERLRGGARPPGEVAERAPAGAAEPPPRARRPRPRRRAPRPSRGPPPPSRRSRSPGPSGPNHPLDAAFGGAAGDARRQDLHPAPLRLVHQRVRRVEAHRLLVQERAQELGVVVHPQPGGLVGRAGRTPPSAPSGSRSRRSPRSASRPSPPPRAPRPAPSLPR